MEDKTKEAEKAKADKPAGSAKKKEKTKQAKTTAKSTPAVATSLPNDPLAAAILTLAATIKEVGYLDFYQETDVEVDDEKLLEIQKNAQNETMAFFTNIAKKIKQ